MANKSKKKSTKKTPEALPAEVTPEPVLAEQEAAQQPEDPPAPAEPSVLDTPVEAKAEAPAATVEELQEILGKPGGHYKIVEGENGEVDAVEAKPAGPPDAKWPDMPDLAKKMLEFVRQHPQGIEGPVIAVTCGAQGDQYKTISQLRTRGFIKIASGRTINLYFLTTDGAKELSHHGI